MDLYVRIGDQRLHVALEGQSLRVDGVPIDVDLAPGSQGPVRSALIGGRSLRVIPTRNGQGDWTVDVEGVSYRVQVLDRRQEAIREARKTVASESGPAPLRAPMPGLVVRVEVSAGDVVQRGDGVIIVEAMKMENELKAEGVARVSAVVVSAGDTVEKDQILVEFQTVEEGE